jgi:hypothetical protein
LIAAVIESKGRAESVLPAKAFENFPFVSDWQPFDENIMESSHGFLASSGIVKGSSSFSAAQDSAVLPRARLRSHSTCMSIIGNSWPLPFSAAGEAGPSKTCWRQPRIARLHKVGRTLAYPLELKWFTPERLGQMRPHGAMNRLSRLPCCR